MVGRWSFTECVYCQGVIGEHPVWYGGYAYHKDCLEKRNSLNKAEEPKDGSLHREGGKS